MEDVHRLYSTTLSFSIRNLNPLISVSVEDYNTSPSWVLWDDRCTAHLAEIQAVILGDTYNVGVCACMPIHTLTHVLKTSARILTCCPVTCGCF